MGKINLTILICLLYSFVSAQFPQEGLTLLHLMKCDKDLNGSIQAITTTAKYFNNPTSKIVLQYKYNDQNLLVDYTEKGSYFYLKSNFTYNKQGQIVKQINKDRKTTLDSIVCRYDNLGRLTVLSIYSGERLGLKSIDKITYDDESRPIKVRTGFASGTRTQELFLKNNGECTIKHRNRRSGEKIARVFNERFTYNPLKHCVEYAERTIDNINGQRTVEVFVDPQSKLRVWVEIEYDNQGNWVKKTAYNFDEKKKVPKREKRYELSRKITYRS